MVVSDEAEASVVHGHKLSTVVPGSVTGENVMHELTGVDLAVKLHYFKFVYYFKHSDILESLATLVLKEPMFPLLDIYFAAAGRIRRSESGWPAVKCNDSGVRIVEAKCEKTLDEWMEIDKVSRYRHVVPEKVVGPEIHFSPTVFVQFTKFKCGGMAVGFSWAHILGDAASAMTFINLYGQMLSGSPPTQSPVLQKPKNKSDKTTKSPPDGAKPRSVMEVEIVGDRWQVPTKNKMVTTSFSIGEQKMERIESKICKFEGKIASFEAISAIFWRCLAKIRDGEPRLVTVCRSKSSTAPGNLSNDLIITTVKIESFPAKTELSELAAAIAKQETDEKKEIEGFVDKETGKPDLILYGANLTFVDLEGLDLHGFSMKGQSPVHGEFAIDGVGEGGAVLLVRRGKEREVTVILPEDQLSLLREVLKNDWDIV